MIDVQYSENVSILQLSDTAFVLKINDAKVYHFLLTHCERELGWGKMIQNNEVHPEYWVLIDEKMRSAHMQHLLLSDNFDNDN